MAERIHVRGHRSNLIVGERWLDPAADRHGLAHPSCLVKSLTLWWMLGRQGITSQLRVGIRKEAGNLEAHAWVERDGIALNEREERHHHYAAFDAALASLPEEER